MSGQDFLIRGYALALRDLCEQSEFVSVTGVLESGATMTYSAGRGCKIIVPAGQVLTIPEDALDDVGLVPAESVLERTARHLDVLADALATPGNGSSNP